MRHVHAVSRGLSDRRVPRTARIGCDEMCVLPDDRVPRFDSGRQRAAVGNHIFGCDICQEVCPWNASPVNTADPAWSLRQDLNLAGLIDLWRRTDAELADFIGDTAMTRAGVKGLRRNHCGRARQLRRSQRARRPGSPGDGRDVQRPAGDGARAMGEAQAGGFYRPRRFVMTYSSTVPRRSRFELMARRAGIR